MKNSLFLVQVVFVFSLFLTVFASKLPSPNRLKQQEAIDPLLARTLLDNDFESGSASPWFDESPGNVNWRVEDFSSPSEVTSPAPRPAIGTSYLRVTRNADLSSGLGVFTSPVFTANPGDKVSFDFWIRSKRPEGNNLELVWLVGNNETVLTGLSQYSTAANFEWRSESVEIPVSTSTNGKLVFYGYCGSNAEDAVAIDNIVVESSTITTPAPGTNCIVLGASVGAFTSPNYPSNYPNNANICWLITNAYQISITFNNFATEIGKDILRVYLGNTTSSELYAELSGSSRPSSFSQFTNSILFVFTSDSANSNTGFSISYDVTKATTTSSTTTSTFTSLSTFNPQNCNFCGAILTDYSGTISSPNYPGLYCDLQFCNYQINVPSGYTVELIFYDFIIESGFDYVYVYDGPNVNYNRLATLSGNLSNSVPIYFNSTSNQMMFWFETDSSNVYSGWYAEYNAV